MHPARRPAQGPRGVAAQTPTRHPLHRRGGATPRPHHRLAFSHGVPLFKEGQSATCAAESLVILGALPPAAEKALRTALDNSASATAASGRAWTLRLGPVRTLGVLAGRHIALR